MDAETGYLMNASISSRSEGILQQNETRLDRRPQSAPRLPLWFGRPCCCALQHQRATVQPLPDSMSAKFALQWRYNGCVACREVCDGVCSAIRYGLSRRDAPCRLGNGCMRPPTAISQANLAPHPPSPLAVLA